MRRYKGLMLAGVICIACSMSACQRTVKDETRTTDLIISENADEHMDETNSEVKSEGSDAKEENEAEKLKDNSVEDTMDKSIESTENDSNEESSDIGKGTTTEAGTIAEIETTTEAIVREVTGGVVEAKQVYTVSQYELENIARDFFMEQAKQTIECGNIDTLEPKSINTMKKKANLNIVSDWDENEFLGLQQTFRIMRNAMVMGSAGEMISYNVSVSNVMNNFNGTYRYYEDSDAILMMAVSLSANSSIQHNSNKTGSGSGYVLLKFKLNKYDSSNKDWELYGIYGYKSSNHKSYEDQADIIRNANWDDYMLKNEDES